MFLCAIEKGSLLEYTGKIVDIVYTCGCNLRCNFCCNPTLVLPSMLKQLSQNEYDLYIEELTHSRITFLDAIVYSGGEPLLHKELKSFMEFIISLKLENYLYTNGILTNRLEQLLKAKLIQKVRVDLKGSELNFEQVTHKSKKLLTNIRQSIILLFDYLDPNDIQLVTVESTQTSKDDIKPFLATLPSKIVDRWTTVPMFGEKKLQDYNIGGF